MESRFYIPPLQGSMKPAMDKTIGHMKSQLSSMAKRDKKERKMIKKATKARMARQRRVRALPDGMREARESNPNHSGKPRYYTVHVDDLEGNVDPAVTNVVEHRSIIFGRFGHEGGGVVLDGMAVVPDNVKYCSASQTYSFQQSKPKSIKHLVGSHWKQRVSAALDASMDVDDDGADQDLPSISGFIQFAMNEPTGFLSVGEHTVPVRLARAPVLEYDSEVAHIQSLKISSTQGVTGFEPGSAAWDEASWDGDFEFQESTIYSRDADGEIVVDIENYFVDTAGPEPITWALTKEAEEAHGANLYDVAIHPTAGGGWAMQTDMADPIGYMFYCPDAPTERANRSVKTVFPYSSMLFYDAFGLSFDGYYLAPPVKTDTSTLVVYAMRGVYKDAFASSSMVPAARAISTVSDAAELAARSALAPVTARATENIMASTTAVTLSVADLLSMSPLVDDVSTEFGHRDAVFDQALADFQDIIVFYMDEGLRKTFVRQSAINLPPAVRSIATDDAGNKDFYKSLQAPLITSLLASTTMEDTDRLNYVRAEKVMQDMPKDNPVFKRHIGKLYNMRYRERFPRIDAYLEDGLVRPSSDFDAVTAKLQRNLELQYPMIEISYGNDELGTLQGRMEEMTQRIQDLGELAKRKRSFWALKLYENLLAVTIPSWHRNNTTVAHAANLKAIKAINCVFGMLEDEATQTSSLSFGQSFNEAVELWQLTAQLPTFVDILGNIDVIDTYMKNILAEYINGVNTNSDAEDYRLYREDIIALHQQDALRRGLISLFAVAQQTATVGVGLLGFQLATAQVTGTAAPLLARFGANPSIMAHFTGALAIALFAYLIIAGGVDFDSLEPGQKATVIGAGTIMAIFGLRTAGSSLMSLPSMARSAGHFFKTRAMATRVRSISLSEIGSPTNVTAMRDPVAHNFRNHPKLTRLAGPPTATTPGSTGPAPAQAGRGRQIWATYGSTRLWMSVFVIMNIATLALSIYFLTESEEPLEIAGNTFLLLSSISALLGFSFSLGSGTAAAGAWAGSLAAAGSVFAAASALLIVVGIILLFVFLSKPQDIQSPVEKFIEDYAGPQGLAMDPGRMTIDYLLDLGAKDEAAQTLGASIQNTNSSLAHRYLALKDALAYAEEGTSNGNEDLPAPELAPGRTLTLSDKDVWTVSTDWEGKTYLSTTRYVQPRGLEGDIAADLNQWVGELWFLGAASDNSVVLKKLPASSAEDYQSIKASIEWTVEVKSIAASEKHEYTDQDGKEQTATSIIAANCTIKKNGLTLAGRMAAGDMTGFQLRSSSADQWRIELQPKFPVAFQYLAEPWSLLTSSEGVINPRIFIPFFSTSSEGFQWSVSPALPSALELVTATGFDEGFIRMKEGAFFTDADIQVPTGYTITCSLTTSSGKLYSAQHTISIEIRSPEEVKQEMIDEVNGAE